jgi:phosphohistidine phosphatase
MKLIVIRHGAYTSDGSLSVEGRLAIGELANRLQGEGIKRIYTSPLLRAVQSAEIIGEALQVPVEEEPALGDDFQEEVLLERIVETIALVGHMPTLAHLVERLVGARVLPHGIGKGGCVILTFEGQIGWGQAKFESLI